MKSIIDLIQYDQKNPENSGTDIEEKFFLYSLVRQIKPEFVLEIGVSCGHSTAWIANGLRDNGKNGLLIAVDNYKKEHGGEASSCLPAFERLKANGLERFVEFITSDSLEYLKRCGDRSVGIVIVDGDHTFKNAFADIKEACRVASELVVVHDSSQFEDVKKSCEQMGGIFIKGLRGYWLKKGNQNG